MEANLPTVVACLTDPQIVELVNDRYRWVHSPFIQETWKTLPEIVWAKVYDRDEKNVIDQKYEAFWNSFFTQEKRKTWETTLYERAKAFTSLETKTNYVYCAMWVMLMVLQPQQEIPQFEPPIPAAQCTEQERMDWLTMANRRDFLKPIIDSMKSSKVDPSSLYPEIAASLQKAWSEWKEEEKTMLFGERVDRWYGWQMLLKDCCDDYSLFDSQCFRTGCFLCRCSLLTPIYQVLCERDDDKEIWECKNCCYRRVHSLRWTDL
jgi:hypothetical protein